MCAHDPAAAQRAGGPRKIAFPKSEAGQDALRFWLKLPSAVLVENNGQTVGAIAVRDELRPEAAEVVAQLRRDGFHISINERETGVAAVSVPLPGASGDVIAAISASGPLETTSRAHLEAQVPELRRAANALQR